MYGTNTWHTKQVIDNAVAGAVYLFTVRFFANLGTNSISIQTALVSGDTHLTKTINGET